MMTLTLHRARWIVIGLVLTGLLLAMVTLFVIGRGGAISTSGMKAVFTYILNFFFPLLSIPVVFLLVQQKRVSPTSSRPISWGSRVGFAILIIAIWIVVPALGLVVADNYESALEFIEITKIVGQTAATAAAAFAFATSSVT